MTLREKLDQIGKWIKEDPSLWDVLTGMRGPDAGLGEPHSERPCDPPGEYGRLYTARVDRKMVTVAVLRQAAFGRISGAKTREADYVTLPPKLAWDHFDKHVARAAGPLGIRVEEGR